MVSFSKKIRIFTNIFLALIVVFIFLISFLPMQITSTYLGESYSVIYNGNRNVKRVSIMVNVYENTEIVNEMVRVLNNHSAKATFFVGGCWADDNQKALENIVKSGHELGNHGYFHKDHKKLDYNGNYQEISLTGKMVKALSGVDMNLFAPPSGSFSNQTLKCAYDLGYRVIMWSKDTIDWRDKDEKKVYKRATENISNGDLILIHPKEHTLNVLEQILTYYESVGLSVVTVSENLL